MPHVPYINDLTLTFLNFSTLSMNQSIKWVHQLTGSQIEAVSISALQAVCGFLFLYGLYQYVLRRKSTYILCMLVSFNVAIIEWAVHPLLPILPTLYFSRSQLFLKTDQEVRELTSVNGLYTVDTLKIGVINDTRWSYCQAVPPISLDYLYLCRGFQGNLKTLVRIFHINQLVLDSSLSFRYREYLKKECDELKIPYTDISEKGSYRILL